MSYKVIWHVLVQFLDTHIKALVQFSLADSVTVPANLDYVPLLGVSLKLEFWRYNTLWEQITLRVRSFLLADLSFCHILAFFCANNLFNQNSVKKNNLCFYWNELFSQTSVTTLEQAKVPDSLSHSRWEEQDVLAVTLQPSGASGFARDFSRTQIRCG